MVAHSLVNALVREGVGTVVRCLRRHLCWLIWGGGPNNLTLNYIFFHGKFEIYY